MITLEKVFSQVSLKLHVNLANVTGSSLLSDCIKKEIKRYLIGCVLEEMKIVCINLIYYKVCNSNFEYKVDKILQLIIISVQKKVKEEFQFLNTNINYSSSEAKWLLKNLESEDGELLKLVLKRLVLDLTLISKRNNHENLQTTKLMISIIETLVIKLTEILTYLLLIELSSNQAIVEDDTNIDILSINSQKNNLYWQSYIKANFLKPKYIYSGVYSLKILTKRGVCNKLVYLPKLRLKEKKYLSTLQFTVLMYLESLDFIFPKIKLIFNNLYRTIWGVL
nr:hypothetical protein [Hemiselmis andersenii]